MRVFGSKTNYELCVKRWEWLLTERTQELRDNQPNPVTQPKEFDAWIYEYADVLAEARIANREADHHRTGGGLSYRKSDMSDEHIQKLPEWWFSISKYKRTRLHHDV